MTVGIYCYIDKKDNSIIYIGKDSNICKNRRHRDHLMPYSYKLQKINQVLQNNPGRYKYVVLKSWAKNKFNKNLANALEILYIKRYSPKFNFTKGGEGISGFKHSAETKKKLSEHFTGKKWTEKSKLKLSKSLKGRKISEEHKKKVSKARTGMKFSQEHKNNISKNHANFKGKNHPQSKYTLWDNEKCHYNKGVMFRRKRDGSKPYSCFATKYRTNILPIGLNMDFVSCEIINKLIEEFTM